MKGNFYDFASYEKKGRLDFTIFSMITLVVSSKSPNFYLILFLYHHKQLPIVEKKNQMWDFPAKVFAIIYSSLKSTLAQVKVKSDRMILS